MELIVKNVSKTLPKESTIESSLRSKYLDIDGNNIFGYRVVEDMNLFISIRKF